MVKNTGYRKAVSFFTELRIQIQEAGFLVLSRSLHSLSIFLSLFHFLLLNIALALRIRRSSPSLSLLLFPRPLIIVSLPAHTYLCILRCCFYRIKLCPSALFVRLCTLLIRAANRIRIRLNLSSLADVSIFACALAIVNALPLPNAYFSRENLQCHVVFQ